MTATAWRDHAACIGKLALFDATMMPKRYHRGDRIDTIAEREARAVCAGCPVRTECLDAELATMRAGESSVGIFGGTDAQERWQLLEREGVRRPRTPSGGHAVRLTIAGEAPQRPVERRKAGIRPDTADNPHTPGGDAA